ncbi:hypothetical protein ABC347_14335 [Sphingomonas sp. 1P06PA]|uniref:hypothetical protein n=1 Tax=Sphingomonas sp. 1P06PA TaxID=554121 RepID=UPI0039A52DC8
MQSFEAQAIRFWVPAAGQDSAVSRPVRHGRALIAMLTARTYPATATLLIHGLASGRHYHVHCAGHGFCRGDEAGEARMRINLAGPTQLIIEPVV